MPQLNADLTFSYELLRLLGVARYGGADIGELLQAGAAIKPGDTESFYQVFHDLASRIDQHGQAIDAAKYPVSARDTFFRAATYYRAADFFIHANPKDPRIYNLFERQQAAFDKAIALLPTPGRRKRIPSADGSFHVETVLYLAEGASAADPRPTLIVSNGFDGAQEEMLHVSGIAGLERGYNILTYDGPGQPTVLRQQGVGFISDWERAVTPVVDYLVTRPEVDKDRMMMFGYSMGGYLCLRAAAFEHRLAAVLAVDGVFDVSKAFYDTLPVDAQKAYDSGEFEKVESIMEQVMKTSDVSTKARWVVDHGLFSFGTRKISELLRLTSKMTLEGVVQQIRCPVWIGSAEDEMFFDGQPEQVKAALGDRGTLKVMTKLDAAGVHCHCGAGAFFNATIFDWLGDTLGEGSMEVSEQK